MNKIKSVISENINDHSEIVGIIYDQKFISDADFINYLIETDRIILHSPVSRHMCKLLDRLDFGKQWSERAKLPTLFQLDWHKYLLTKTKVKTQ